MIDWKKISIIFFFILIIFGSLYYIFFYPLDCKSNQDCFKSALQSCKRARLTTLEQGNDYLYTIKGNKEGNCIVDIKLEKLYSASYDLITLLEGKSMRCVIPKEVSLFEKGVEGTINYCSGPLKEAMYEIIIQRLYNLIAQDLGSAVVELEDVLKAK